jgi:hypothetical protein
MARTTGSKNVKSSGDQTISTPAGDIILDPSSTKKVAVPQGDVLVDKGKLTVNNGKFIVNKGQVLVGITTTTVATSATHNVGNIRNILGIDNPTGNSNWPDQYEYSTTEQRQLAGAYFAGGVGIEKDLAVGGFIYGRISSALTATTSTQLLVQEVDEDKPYYLTFTPNSGNTYLYLDKTGQVALDNPAGLSYNPFRGLLQTEKVEVVSTASTVDLDTAALVVKGGVAISENIMLGGEVYSVNNFTGSYLESIYSKYLDSSSRTSTLALGAGQVDIFGDLRVRGNTPIGTAPVVTNVLYVTMDGDDTNDGRAMDASRACRTIGGALNSPYYQPGTQIRVSPGLYLEDNPLQLKPYTSIIGSDLRTCSIEPINKTQDLFHLNSGCHLACMQFLNGRSGLLEGDYAPGFNRGAYATAFPPLEGEDRINLFHSPYVQNCTNQSGPWLRDGTMFIPNQTVQVPAAVGTGTWVANTTTLLVTVSTGTIARGMAVNAGQQNPGFFNARTLLLANKPFLQGQVVAYIDDQFPGFDYSREKCYRDVGILVENTAYDAAFGGNEKSVESGLAYYDGVVSVIAGQETQTTAAIEYLRDRSLEVVKNTTCTNTYTGLTSNQVINWVLTGGGISTSSIRSLYGIVTATIASPDNSPAVYRSTGPDAAFVSAEILMQANRTFIQENVINYINNELANPPKNLKFNKIKCKRDIGLVLDSVALDMLYPTPTHSQSTFAGLQYYTQSSYTGDIPNEITTTTAAIVYLRDLAVKIIQNITPADDLIPRYGAGIQNTSLEPASINEVKIVNKNFNTVIEIIKGNNLGWSDKIVSNGTASNLLGVRNAVALLKANKENGYFANEIIAYIATVHSTFTAYDINKCKRDVGYIVDSISFDLLHGGNRQSVQSGLNYYRYNSTRNIRDSERAATVASFNYIAELANYIVKNQNTSTYQTRVKQVTLPAAGSNTEVNLINRAISTVTSIISNGTGTVTWGLTPISTSSSVTSTGLNSFNLLLANKEFIKEEVVARLDQLYNPGSFNYNEELCYRDTGLIVDAVSQDILLGGNQKSIEAGLSYWNQGFNYVATQITTTTNAINYARDVALEVIANRAVTPQTGTVSTQIINTFFQYGGDYMPQEAVKRNFKIITDIIEKGPSAAPPVYAGGGVFALTGINGSDVKLSPRVTSVTGTNGVYTIGLDSSTIGFGNNATLYFGNTDIFPKQDFQVEELSLQYTGDSTTWNQRRVDPIGAMGGSLVDGSVISKISPIQSFVYDAFTQVNQGGKGIHITNDGYAQLVSVFTIFCSVAVLVENGGIASVTNSNSNFGDLCLVAKGYGSRAFSGTVFNPPNRAYPFSPGPDGLDEYYPSGYWPNKGLVEIFTPDISDRPHISLVMEVVPPDGHLNEQSLPGFLNAQPSTGTLTTSTIVLRNIDTTNVAVGNTVYIRDQYGSEYDKFPNRVDTFGNEIRDSSGNLIPNPDYLKWYAATGTVVTKVDYNAITLNQALTHGGSDPINPDYFTLYFCGKSYYSVITSTVANAPYEPGNNILVPPSDRNKYQGPITNQVDEHIASIIYLNNLTNRVISNTTGTTYMTTSSQVVLPSVKGGSDATPFINERFGYITGIIGAVDLNAAKAVVPPAAIKKEGTVVLGAGSAITLIEANLNFLADEVTAYVHAVEYNVFSGLTDEQIKYIDTKCKRDTKIILQRLIYDLETGGTYNSVMAGLSYWSREGTHHIVELGEALFRTDLFPDGATVNFYQRSYMSASGYLFEYVGAGTNYGALPQRGIKDPVQTKETVQLDGGKVFFTSTDQNGDFRIGPGLVISQATGVLSGRTFVQSLYANMTPFILAIE